MTDTTTNNNGDIVLRMIQNELHEVKSAIKEHQVETREEFRRVRDKIDDVNTKFLADSKTSAIDLKVLETKHAAQAKIAGRVAGAVAGFFTALVTTVAGVLAKYFLGGGT